MGTKICVGVLVFVVLWLGFFHFVVDKHVPQDQSVAKVVETTATPPKSEPTTVNCNVNSKGTKKGAVKVNLESTEFNLKQYYISAEQLALIQEGDRASLNNKDCEKNNESSFKTSLGEFRVISCFGRKSVDPNAFGESRGMVSLRQDMLQLPNGQWVVVPRGFSVQQTFESDKDVYVLCDRCIFKVAGPEKVVTVVSLQGKDSCIHCSGSDHGRIAGRYWEVHKSSYSDFGGLLEYTDGKWNFYPYEGSYSTWVERTQSFNEDLMLVLYSKQAIIFQKNHRKFIDFQR